MTLIKNIHLQDLGFNRKSWGYHRDGQSKSLEVQKWIRRSCPSKYSYLRISKYLAGSVGAPLTEAGVRCSGAQEKNCGNFSD